MSDKKNGFCQLVKCIVDAVRQERKAEQLKEPEIHFPSPSKPEPRSPESLEQERRERVYAQQHSEPPAEDLSGERKIDLLEKIQTLEQEVQQLRKDNADLKKQLASASDEAWSLRQERDDLAKRLRDADNYIRSHS